MLMNTTGQLGFSRNVLIAVHAAGSRAGVLVLGLGLMTCMWPYEHHCWEPGSQRTRHTVNSQ